MNLLGDGLHIGIKANYTYANDWMSFACWYSLSKILPDAIISLVCKNVPSRRQLFRWPRRCGIFTKSSLEQPFLLLDCGTMAIRQLNEETLAIFNSTNELTDDIFCQVSEDKYVPFVSYRGAWGNFVESEWIDKEECPFPFSERFMTHSSNANEIQIIKIWKQLSPMYATVSRG